MSKFIITNETRVPWRFQWHTIPEKTGRAKKAFFPGGPKITKGNIESILSQHKKSIIESGNRLFQDGIELNLGERPLSEIANNKVLGWHLYRNVIHPRFFAEALEFLAGQSQALDLKPQNIFLTKLNRYSIASAVKEAICESDIGVHFERFGSRTNEEKAKILAGLGVLNQKEEKAPEEVVLEPKPPIINIDPRAKFVLVSSFADQLEKHGIPASSIDFENVLVSPKIKGKALKSVLKELEDPDVKRQIGNNLQLLHSMGATKISLKVIRTKAGSELKIRARGVLDQFESASLLLVQEQQEMDL